MVYHCLKDCTFTEWRYGAEPNGWDKASGGCNSVLLSSPGLGYGGSKATPFPKLWRFIGDGWESDKNQIFNQIFNFKYSF